MLGADFRVREIMICKKRSCHAYPRGRFKYGMESSPNSYRSLVRLRTQAWLAGSADE